jgi:hypothetical protein
MKQPLTIALWSLSIAFTSSRATGNPITTLSDTVVDTSALTLPDDINFGQLVNGRVYQQDLLVTHGNWQYAAYYNGDRHVCVARRSLPDGSWEIVELDDYTMTSYDSHNIVSIGIAPADGTIHLAFDHHVSDLHYRKTAIGAAHSNTWSADLFGPVTNQLISGEALTITYPRFESTPAGDLLFCYRDGFPSNGDRIILRYNVTTGMWGSATLFVSRTGDFTDTYGTSPSRSGYLNPVVYGASGRLHATWVWREKSVDDVPGSKDNHDLMYLYSDDDGQSWQTGSGSTVTGGGRVDTSGITAISIPRGLGLINSNAQTVDDQGRVHLVLRHCTDESLAAAGSSRGEVAFGPSAARRLHHYWRDFDNTWHHRELPGSSGSRSAALVADSHGNLFYARLKYNTLEILQALVQEQWTDWQVVHSVTLNSGVELTVDRSRWKTEAVLSFPYQKTPNNWGDDSALRVIDFALAPERLKISAMYQHEINILADAYVRNDGTQDGAGATVYVKNHPNDLFDRITYLQFDLSKIALPIFSARLKLYVNTITGPVAVSMYEISDNSWTEQGITWENAPTFGDRIGIHTVTTGDTFIEWDLTESLATNPAPIRTFALWPENPTSENLTLRAKEYGDDSFQPQLIIESESPYTQWASGHDIEAEALAPDGDANTDGVLNLIAFSMGAASPITVIHDAPIEFTHEAQGMRASIRRASAAAAFSPALEQLDSLGTGNWASSQSEQLDSDYYGPGIDRISILTDQDSQFFRYTAEH